MIDVHRCNGCHNDFYNGHNNIGVQQCWHLKDAKLVPRLLIHVDQAPPYKHIKQQMVPHCYKMKRFVTVAPESLTSDGYWR